jgi:hypothetical protein
MVEASAVAAFAVAIFAAASCSPTIAPPEDVGLSHRNDRLIRTGRSPWPRHPVRVAKIAVDQHRDPAPSGAPVILLAFARLQAL